MDKQTGVLSGQRIVITRAEGQNSDGLLPLIEHGAQIILMPTIKIIVSKKNHEFNALLNESYDYIIFTSVNAVLYFLKQSDESSTDWIINAAKVISIGQKTTKYCLEFNIPVFYTAGDQHTGGFIDEMNSWKLKSKRILFPCGNLTNDTLESYLAKRGAIVRKLVVYENILPEKETIKTQLNDIQENGADFFVFTSPSTFSNFLALTNWKLSQFSSSKIVAIGETTKKAIEEIGVKVDLIPQSPSLENISKIILNYQKEKVYKKEQK